jgi:hypothetical protein
LNYLIAILAALLVTNIWISRYVWRYADDLGNRKLLLLMGIWILPFLGAIIANQQMPRQHVSAIDTLHLKRTSHEREAAPEIIQVTGTTPFDLSAHLSMPDSIPILDWQALQSWALTAGNAQSQRQAIELGRKAWLLQLRDQMGPYAQVHESEHALILSSLEPNVVRATADYLESTRRRIARVLDQAVDISVQTKSILLVFDHLDDYYRYVSLYYPEEGEFAFSGGMFINSGCPHFVMVSADLSVMEPVIVHEMTHHAVSHLQLPKWLDEGVAVNTEYRLTGARHSIYSPREMQQKHASYWNAESIQEFWSGRSFDRTDDGNMLSYELARIIVEQMALQWKAFCVFLRTARREDAGASAALHSFSFDLGHLAAVLLEVPSPEGWSPDPSVWEVTGDSVDDPPGDASQRGIVQID